MNQVPGFWRGFATALVIMLGFTCFQAVAGGGPIADAQQDLRDVERSLDRLVSELSSLRREGIAVRASEPISVRMPSEITVRTGAYPFEVRNK